MNLGVTLHNYLVSVGKPIPVLVFQICASCLLLVEEHQELGAVRGLEASRSRHGADLGHTSRHYENENAKIVLKIVNSERK